MQLVTEMPAGSDDHALGASHHDAVSSFSMCKATASPCDEVPLQWCEARQAMGAKSLLRALAEWS